MQKGLLPNGRVLIKHLDNPNIMTFVNGEKIEIKNHQAEVSIDTAKAMMEGPYGYELIGVYDNFLQYVDEIQKNIKTFGGAQHDSDTHVLLATPLSGQKFYSWLEYSTCLTNLDNKQDISVALVIDTHNADWIDLVEAWANNYKKHFRNIFLVYWNSDTEMAWNRVFKITVARQMIFNFAKQLNQFSHIWFVDSDNLHKSDALTTLLSHNKDCCAGLYNFKSVMAGGPVVFNAKGKIQFPPTNLGEQQVSLKPDSGLHEADWTGAGSLLLSKRIFEKYNFDWSKWIQRHGEDAYICLLAQQETGEKVLVDTHVFSDHLDENGKRW